MNPSEKIIENLKDEVERLEGEVADFEDDPPPDEDYEEVTEAILRFCFDCPIQDNVSKCNLCYLNKWKER